MESESSLFEENKSEARAQYRQRRNLPWYGWQATVREKMRGKDVDEDKDKESDQKSIVERAGGGMSK